MEEGLSARDCRSRAGESVLYKNQSEVVPCLTVVSLALGCAIAERYRLKRRHQAVYVTIKCIYFALYVVLPVTVMVINVLLIREVRRAKNNILTL